MVVEKSASIMEKILQPTNISEEERTRLFGSLLTMIEQLAERVRQQDEEIQLLKDEIRILKGEKKRPTFKPSKLDKDTEKSSKGEAEGEKRPSAQVQTSGLKMQN